MTYGPEVLDDFVLFGVAPVVGMLLPVLDIDVGDTADEQFELSLVEDVDEIWGNQFVEACDEGVELFFDPLLDAPFGDEANFVNKVPQIDRKRCHLLYVFLLVLVGHCYVATIWLQVYCDRLTESLVVGREGQL